MPREIDLIIRRATIEDAHVFVRVFDMAGDGLPTHLWQASAAPDETPADVGLRRMRAKLADEDQAIAWVAEKAGQVAGGLLANRVGDIPDVIEEGTNPIIVPLIELENEAPETFYVNALAVFPEYQRLGVARALMHRAEEKVGPKGMSLIVEDQKTDARQLYENLGYEERTSRPVVEGEWKSNSTRYHLLVKPPR